MRIEHARETLVELAAATLVMMLTVAVRVPEADGVQVTRTVQLVPAAMPAAAVEQLSDETLKSAAFVPVTLGAWTTSGPVPVFVTVTLWGAVVTPMPLLVKKSEVGLTDLP